MNRIYAEVIGDPISHSKSPTIHNFWLAKLGIDAEYRACHVRAEDLADYFAQRRTDPDWRGCNITMPHKLAVMSMISDLSPLARQVGAANVIIPHEGRLAGGNTDATGFMEPLKRLMSEGSMFVGTAVVIGGGGAARAIATALWSAGFGLDIVNRNRDRARAIADHVIGGDSAPIRTSSFLQLKELVLGPDKFQPPDLCLIVNASAMGMTGVAPPDVDLKYVPKSVVVYDAVYDPLETALLRSARDRGLVTIDGLAMLIGQAAEAFERFFGTSPPREHDIELRTLLTS
jgi:shikimate dehydrogenase